MAQAQLKLMILHTQCHTLDLLNETAIDLNLHEIQ